MNSFALVALVVLTVAGHAQPPTPQSGSEADRQAIGRVREQEIATLISGDVEKHLALVTDDVVLMPPNAPAVVGKEAVRAHVQKMCEQFKFEGTTTSGSDLRVLGDWAFERLSGKLKLTPVGGGPVIQDVLKGLHVYRRQGGGWKIAYDVWNSDMPLPTAK